MTMTYLSPTRQDLFRSRRLSVEPVGPLACQPADASALGRWIGERPCQSHTK